MTTFLWISIYYQIDEGDKLYYITTSTTRKTDYNDTTDILLKVVLNTHLITHPPFFWSKDTDEQKFQFCYKSKIKFKIPLFPHSIHTRMVFGIFTRKQTKFQVLKWQYPVTNQESIPISYQERTVCFFYPSRAWVQCENQIWYVNISIQVEITQLSISILPSSWECTIKTTFVLYAFHRWKCFFVVVVFFLLATFTVIFQIKTLNMPVLPTE